MQGKETHVATCMQCGAQCSQARRNSKACDTHMHPGLGRVGGDRSSGAAVMCTQSLRPPPVAEASHSAVTACWQGLANTS